MSLSEKAALKVAQPLTLFSVALNLTVHIYVYHTHSKLAFSAAFGLPF
jgi:hypothetical protein